MAYRNMEQITKKINDLLLNTDNKYLTCYSMNIDEMCKLYEMCLDGKQIEAICMAFDYGFALGIRAHDRQRVPVL